MTHPGGWRRDKTAIAVLFFFVVHENESAVNRNVV